MRHERYHLCPNAFRSYSNERKHDEDVGKGRPPTNVLYMGKNRFGRHPSRLSTS